MTGNKFLDKLGEVIMVVDWWRKIPRTVVINNCLFFVERTAKVVLGGRYRFDSHMDSPVIAGARQD